MKLRYEKDGREMYDHPWLPFEPSGNLQCINIKNSIDAWLEKYRGMPSGTSRGEFRVYNIQIVRVDDNFDDVFIDNLWIGKIPLQS